MNLQLKKRLTRMHWFDIAIGTVALTILVSFFFFFYRKATYIIIRVKVTDQEVLTANHEPKMNYAWRFVVGDKERDVVGRVITEIVGVDSYPIDPERKVVYVDLKVRATYDTRTKMYAALGKNLMYGTPMRFNLGNVTFDGIVTQTPNGFPLNVKEKIVKVKAFAGQVSPSLAKEIKVGDTVTNSLGQELVKITKVEVSLADQVTQDVNGNLQVKKHPLSRDVYLELELHVREVNRNEVVMFDDYKVNVGALIPINLRRYNIYPAINDIEGI